MNYAPVINCHTDRSVGMGMLAAALILVNGFVIAQLSNMTRW
jgi:hypothetical protein